MDKRLKQHRQKQPTDEELTDEELTDATPPGASFDTEAGRAAQGMRDDFDQASPDRDKEPEDQKSFPEEKPKK